RRHGDRRARARYGAADGRSAAGTGRRAGAREEGGRGLGQALFHQQEGDGAQPRGGEEAGDTTAPAGGGAPEIAGLSPSPRPSPEGRGKPFRGRGCSGSRRAGPQSATSWGRPPTRPKPPR